MIGDSMFGCFSSVKDLGVMIDSHVCFGEHIDGIISKAKQRMYLLFKAFNNRDINLMIFAFKVYILPSLELRRLTYDLVLCYKIVHKLINLNFNDFF